MSAPAGGPSPFSGKVVLLGVTGGIAAYKAVALTRAFVDAGAHVVVVMTEAARRFVGEVTFSALASEPVRTSLFDDADPIPHTRLGQRADLVIVAPATAHAIASYAAGLADDLLGATLLATEAPVLLCPAMHAEMWRHPSVEANLATLRARGVAIVPPGEGRLAGGDVGVGRLADPEEIVARAAHILAGAHPARQGDLAGYRVVVSAGGTREAIDPVRFLGNRSSGRQGYALAEAARDRGAVVTLVTASELPPPHEVEVVAVESAEEMRGAMVRAASGADVVVMAAAVADFRVASAAGEKLKRTAGVPTLVLEPTPDILAELVASRPAGQVVVGFAAETSDALREGVRKLEDKGVDLLCVNDVSQPGVGFGHETNALTILDRLGGRQDVARTSKREAADAVLDAVLALSKKTAS